MFLCLFRLVSSGFLGCGTGTIGFALGLEQLRLGLLGTDILLVVQAVEQTVEVLALLNADVAHTGATQAIEVCPAAQCLTDVAGKGTYIRSLARDIGQALGSGAYLTALCRTRLGEVRIEDCYTFDSFPQWLDEQQL